MKRDRIIIFILVFLVGGFSVFAQTEIESFIKKSDEFDRQNKLPEAVAELTKAINLQPDNAEYYLKRAELNFGIPNYEAVAEDANRAARLKPDDKQTILTATRFLRNIRKCGEARDLLDDFAAKQTASDDVFYARSHSKMCLGDWAGAYEDMFKASELAPQNNHYRTTLAGMLSKLGDSDKALEQLERLIKFYTARFMKQRVESEKFTPDRTLSEVYRIRAGIHHAAKNETAEFADLQNSVEFAPLDSSYAMRAKIYADHEMYAEAVADYTKALKDTLNPAIYHFERGEIYVLMKKYDEAVKDYTAAANKDAGFKDFTEKRIAWIKQKLSNQ